MFSRAEYRGGGGSGLTGDFPPDVVALVAIPFATLSLSYLGLGPLMQWLQLGPAVWQRLCLWQIFTYPWVGNGGAGFWFVVSLVVLYMFAKDVFYRLGRRMFWSAIVWASGGAAIAAVLVHIILTLLRIDSTLIAPFVLMQGQTMLMTIVIALFATLNARATIMLMFVIPVEARLFILLEIVFAFLGFLTTRDFAGFVGICTAVGISYAFVSPTRARTLLDDLSLRVQRAWILFKLKRMSRKRDFRVVRDDDRRGPWVH